MHKSPWHPPVVILALLLPAPVFGQTYLLSETPRDGECFRLATQTILTGTLKVTREGKLVPVRINATNEHAYVEKVLATEKGEVRKAGRHYQAAVSRSSVDGEKLERSLAAEHRLIVAQREADGLFCYSPAGVLTRPELEVVSEHFESLALGGLLPGKEVKVSDTWKLDNGPAQNLCLFDGLVSQDLTGRLMEVSSGTAVCAVEGTAKGIENGALATLTVTATVRFDLGSKRIVAVEWKQKDVRDQGPVSPAAEVESVTTLKREALGSEPGELSAAATTAEPPPGARYLLHRDPKGRYQLLHGRDWHLVGQTDYHLILRLLDRGDFVAQATLTAWTSAGAGKHVSPEEFEKLVSAGTGWKPEEVVDRAEVPTDGDRWAFRVIARGELDGTKVVQNFYVIAAPGGEQMILTFTMKPNAADRVGTRDVALVKAIEFPKK